MATTFINALLLALLVTVAYYAYEQREQFQLYYNKYHKTSQQLDEATARTFALGENLWNKKHTYDIKFIINTTKGLAEFYAHKHILTANSEYFEILFANNKTNLLEYTNLTKMEFNALLELLYFGKFNTSLTLQCLPNILQYMDTFMLMKYVNYTDSYFSTLVTARDDYIYDFPTVHTVYALSKEYNMPLVARAILMNIYNDWKHQGLFNVKHVSAYPQIFYDYIKKLNCYNIKFA